jgi:hypothetical protein
MGMFSISATDTPTVSDSALVMGMFSISATDTPTVSDSALVMGMFSISATDTPTVSDSALVMGIFSISETDTPAVSDSATITIETTDVPSVSDSALVMEMFSISAIDAPTVSDSAFIPGMFSISAIDAPTVSDFAELSVLEPLPEPETPKSPKGSSSSGGGGGSDSSGGGFTMAPNLVLYDGCTDVNQVRIIASTYGDNLAAIIYVDDLIIQTTDVTEKINPYDYIDLQIRTPIEFYTFDTEVPDDINSFTIKIYDKSKKQSLYSVDLLDDACTMGKVLSHPKGATMIVPKTPYFNNDDSGILIDSEPEVDSETMAPEMESELLECGTDEILIDGQCVLPEPVPECGADEILIDGQCVLPEPVPECGTDEILIDGQCVLPEPVPECGAGTHIEKGICVVDENLGGGCLIATATFGSELAPQVQQLRELRDGILLQTDSGSAFMSEFNKMYYLFSPTIADWERQNPVFKETVKLFITPMISSLSIMTLVDGSSEFELWAFGVLVIAFNIGLYIVVPVAFGCKVYRQYRYRK